MKVVAHNAKLPVVGDKVHTERSDWLATKREKETKPVARGV